MTVPDVCRRVATAGERTQIDAAAGERRRRTAPGRGRGRALRRTASMSARMNLPASGAFLNWLPLVAHAMNQPGGSTGRRWAPSRRPRRTARPGPTGRSGTPNDGTRRAKRAHGGLEPLDGGVLVEVVGVVDPLERIALGLGAAHQQRAAGLRPEVLAEVEVDRRWACRVERQLHRARCGEHLLAQRSMTDAHVVGDAGEPVDRGRVRPGGVHHHRRLDGRAVVQRDAGRSADRRTAPRSLADGTRTRRRGGEPRARCCARPATGRRCSRHSDRTRPPADRARRRRTRGSSTVFGGKYEPTSRAGNASHDLVGIEALVRNADVVPELGHPRQRAARRVEDQHAGAHERGHAVGVDDAQVLGPVDASAVPTPTPSGPHRWWSS